MLAKKQDPCRSDLERFPHLENVAFWIAPVACAEAAILRFPFLARRPYFAAKFLRLRARTRDALNWETQLDVGVLARRIRRRQAVTPRIESMNRQLQSW